MKARVLPLGVDIGATRIRVAASQRSTDGVALRGVAVRDVYDGHEREDLADDHLSGLLADAVDELGVRERRVVAGVGLPDAFLRSVDFPKMTAVERRRAAQFEAQRLVPLEPDQIIVRVADGEAPTVLGVARRESIARRAAIIRKAGLIPIAIDNEALALRRVLTECDAIVDIGCDRTIVHVFGEHLPLSQLVHAGGRSVTDGIAHDLAIDTLSAERRKKILGVAGAGENARAELVGEIVASLAVARERRSAPGRIALVGNGARLAGLASEISANLGAQVECGIAAFLRAGTYPDDVIRAAAPDWTLACGLSLWESSG